MIPSQQHQQHESVGMIAEQIIHLGKIHHDALSASDPVLAALSFVQALATIFSTSASGSGSFWRIAASISSLIFEHCRACAMQALHSASFLRPVSSRSAGTSTAAQAICTRRIVGRAVRSSSEPEMIV